MSNRYVTVTITRQTKAVSQAGFGLPLILSHEKVSEYKEYRDIDGIATDFGVESATYKMASALFGQSPRPFKIAIHGILNDAPGTPDKLVEALNELIKKHNDFFYVLCTDQTDEAITAIAKWVNTQSKFYFASTSNKALHAALKSQNTILLVTDKPDEHPAVAWVGNCAPREIGGYTWTFKTLNGIVPDNYDETELGEIEKGANAYISEGGVDITSKGVTTTGEYIDILQGQYFLESRLTEAIFGLLARMPKVPYTDAGISIVVAETESVLKRASNQGITAVDSDDIPLYAIKAPKASEVATNDKAQRILPDVNWTATIAGAVENVQINGVLKL